MSQENVDLVTRAVRAATARPQPDFATMNALFHPDHVLVPTALDIDEVRGGRGYQAFLREQAQPGLSQSPAEAAMSWEADLEGAVDVSGDKVLCVVSARFRGSASGVHVSQRQWAVATVRDGRVFRTEIYSDPADALGAVGLRE
jgi:ketosteroid isomerase-like protein